MDKLYIAHDLPELIRIVYSYLEPRYTCRLVKRKNDASTLACTAHYFNKIRRTCLRKIPRDICLITKRIKILCKTHCKAYPIYEIIWRHTPCVRRARTCRTRDPCGFFEVQTWPSHMLFPTKHIARFAPHILPNIRFILNCCGGAGWQWDWHRNRAYPSGDWDTEEEEEEDAEYLLTSSKINDAYTAEFLVANHN